MSEVFKVAKFKLRLSNRKKRVLKNLLIKYTNASSDILTILEPNKNKIEYDSIEIKTSKNGKERIAVNNSIIYGFVSEAVNNSIYKSYQRKESLIKDITYSISSYISLRLDGQQASFPSIPKYNAENDNRIKYADILQELVNCGIEQNGISTTAHEKETLLAGELSKIAKNKLLPFSFLRSRDFTIIEKIEDGKTPTRLALLNIFNNETGKQYLSKHGKEKPLYTGRCISNGEDIEHSSVTKLPVILEWSLFHDLNYFKIGSPKTAKLIYDNSTDTFYLNVTFSFLPHINEEGKLIYLKTKFDEESTREYEHNIASNKKLKYNLCYDALSGELVNVPSINKTTVTKHREMTSFLGVDLGRTMIASFAVVKKAKVLFKGFAESQSLTKKLYSIYDEIAEKQKAGKQNKKSLSILHKKISQLTKNSVHQTANRIIWARKYYDSNLVMENLEGLKNLPRKKVQQYKRISDLLTYKSLMNGFPLVKFKPEKAYFEIRPSLTSKMCSRCGFVHDENRRIEVSQKDFKCVACGYEDNADINASINIARLGEYKIKYQEVYASFDEYLKTLANCPNTNYENYFENIKNKKVLKGITSLLDKRIKERKKLKSNTLI